MRPMLRALASAWLVCQLAGLIAAPVAMCVNPAEAAASAEDACCPGVAPGQVCPMHHTRERLRKAGVVDSQGLRSLSGGESIIVAGLVTIRQRPASANGTIFLLLEDEWGFINVVVPSFLVDEFSEVVKFATFVLVQGRFEKDGNG